MDIYTLDNVYNIQTPIIDVYDSLIWTERFNSYGDCTIVLPGTSIFRDVLIEGVKIAIAESDQKMEIQNVVEEDGRIKLTGRSFVDIFRKRILRYTYMNASSSWAFTDTPQNVIKTIVEQMCVAGGRMDTNLILPGTMGPYEIIPGLAVDIASVSGTTTIDVTVEYGNVYDGIKTVADLQDVGFKIITLPSGFSPFYILQLKLYTGLDRTSTQSTNPVVIFDSAMDTLVNVRQLRSIEGYVTSAYAWPGTGSYTQARIGEAHVAGTDFVTGFARKTLMVDATDINPADYTGTALKAALDQRAKNALVNNNYVRMFDGTVVPQNGYAYGVGEDYYLGDIIELRGDTTTIQKARITEYTRSKDATGTYEYPTLSVID
jgi:hypothetical protein